MKQVSESPAPTEAKPKFIVVSAVKQLIKDLGNQSGPDFLMALDAQVSASVRKACNDEGPNKRLNEASLGAPVIEPCRIDDRRAKIKELRDTAVTALLQVNVVTKRDYLNFFNEVKGTLQAILNDK